MQSPAPPGTNQPSALVATQAPVIRFDQIGKTFYTKGAPVNALTEIDLSFSAGEFVTIIGPSGCGKSTLLRLLAGFAYPTAGTIYCHGTPVHDINTQIGFISQENDLYPWMTLLENVEFPLVARKIPPAERRARAQALINLVGLAGFEDRYPYELSGGMQKRASIVRTMIYEPDIVAMDEPFGPLDAQTRLVLQHELLKIWNRQQMTILFVTHDLVEAIALSDRVIVMTKRPGRVKQVLPVNLGRPRNVFEIHDQPGFRETHHELWRLMQSELTMEGVIDTDPTPVSIED
jgi:NitT/TauT family transport system ATP-binding protein